MEVDEALINAARDNDRQLFWVEVHPHEDILGSSRPPRAYKPPAVIRCAASAIGRNSVIGHYRPDCRSLRLRGKPMLDEWASPMKSNNIGGTRRRARRPRN